MAQRLQGGLVGGGAIDFQQGVEEQRCCDPSGVGMGVTYPQARPTQANKDVFPGEGSVQRLPCGDPGQNCPCRPGHLTQSLSLPLWKVGVMTPSKARLRGQPQAGGQARTEASQA